MDRRGEETKVRDAILASLSYAYPPPYTLYPIPPSTPLPALWTGGPLLLAAK